MDGRVRIDADFDEDGVVSMLDMTIDKLKVGGTTSAYERSYEIEGIPVESRGDFTADTLTAPADNATSGHSVMGQFYGPEEDMPTEVGGVIELINGHQGASGEAFAAFADAPDSRHRR